MAPLIRAEALLSHLKMRASNLMTDSQPPLSWSSELRPLKLKWHMGRLGKLKLGFSAGLVGKIGKDLIWLDPVENKIGKFEEHVSEGVLQFLARSPVLESHEVDQLVSQMPTHLGSFLVPPPPRMESVHRKATHRQVRLELDVAKTKSSYWRRGPAVTLPTLKLSFDYEGQSLDYSKPGDPRFVNENQIITLERDLDWEDSCLDRLHMCGAVDPFDIVYETPSNKMAEADLVFDEDRTEEAIRFTFHEIPKLRSEGWDIQVSARWPFKLEEREVILSTFTQSTDGESFQGHSWFDLGFQAEVDGRQFDLAPLIASFMGSFATRYAYEVLPDLETFCAEMEKVSVYTEVSKGRYISVKLKPLLPVLYLFLSQQIELGNMHPSDARVAAQVQDALEGSEVQFSDQAGILPLAKSFESLLETKTYSPPSGLQADLRPYQAVGAEWMTQLTQSGFGGVLADDMGLGKTLQTLAVLLSRKQQRAAGSDRGAAPSLLIVPTSLLSTWQNQAAQFTPDLRLLLRHGKERHDTLSEIKDADLVVTTYPLLARDRDVLAEFNWDLVIVDEAQTLKNPASQMAKALRDLSSAGRLALTGTPLENSLQDLWTLFDWVVPGLLGNRKTFTSLFRTPIEKKGSAEAQARLNRRIHPFLLRRTKEQVAADLPPRTEILEPVTLGKAQQGLYESVRAAMDERVRNAVASKGFNRAQITILDALLKLRQVCCDPALVKTKAAQSITESAKRERLQEFLQELLAEGRKVLVFSQFTSMLDLIAEDLNKLGTDYTMLTGQTKDRQAVLERFTSDEVSVFLLSLKAGGVGLTLIQADTVVLYDPWWNPAAERQAMDRVHRIGQDKPVFVHRLVATGTVEEKVLALQAQKQALADEVLSSSDTDLPSRFDEATLQDLFAPLVPKGG